METDVAPECWVVFGGGRMGPNGLTDMRRIELRFMMAGHVRVAPKHDDEDIKASGFQVVRGYTGPAEDYLNWSERNWLNTGICPNSGFYVATESDWLRNARMKYGDAPKHFILAGRDGYIETIAESPGGSGSGQRDCARISRRRAMLSGQATVLSRQRSAMTAHG